MCVLRLHGLSVTFTYVWSVGQGIRRFVLGLVSGLLPAASNAAQGVFTVTNNHFLDRVPAQSGRDQCEGWLRDKGLMTMALVTPGVLNPLAEPITPQA